MKMLSIKPTIYKFKTAEEFAAEFKIGVGDLVITNEYIYQPFFGKLNLGCDVLYQEKYGAGEPSDDMAEAMYKDIKGDHKLIEMTHLNETLYCCGIACSAEGHKTESGNYIIDLLLANVCKQNVTRFPYEIVRLAEDIAGGLMVTAPSEKDLRDEKIGPYIDKYLRGVATVTTENRMKILRLIENLALGTAAVGYRTESMHGAGSPQAQRIMISRQGNLNAKKELAKAIAHIEE